MNIFKKKYTLRKFSEQRTANFNQRRRGKQRKFQ